MNRRQLTFTGLFSGMKRNGGFPLRFNSGLRLLLILLIPVGYQTQAQTTRVRLLSGTVVTAQNEIVPDASLAVAFPSGEQKGTTDAEGRFRFTVPAEPLTLRIEGQYIISQMIFSSIKH